MVLQALGFHPSVKDMHLIALGVLHRQNPAPGGLLGQELSAHVP